MKKRSRRYIAKKKGIFIISLDPKTWPKPEVPLINPNDRFFIENIKIRE